MSELIPVWAIASVLVAAVLAANVPFLNNRLFLVGPVRAPKPLTWRLVELLIYAILVVLLGRTLEGHLGQVSEQRWEFYAVWSLAFLTLAFPGFVWRYLRRGSAH